jgi:hypothetical protein
MTYEGCRCRKANAESNLKLKRSVQVYLYHSLCICTHMQIIHDMDTCFSGEAANCFPPKSPDLHIIEDFEFDSNTFSIRIRNPT